MEVLKKAKAESSPNDAALLTSMTNVRSSHSGFKAFARDTINAERRRCRDHLDTSLLEVHNERRADKSARTHNRYFHQLAAFSMCPAFNVAEASEGSDHCCRRPIP